MDSRQDISKSTENCIETAFVPVDGYSLKKKTLKRWIYGHNLTQPYVARKLNLDPVVFKEKLRNREKFNSEQIRALVLLMKAEDAFKVLYFPSNRFRRKIWWQVFGQYQNKEELNE